MTKDEFHLLRNYVWSGDKVVNWRRFAPKIKEGSPQALRLDKLRHDMKWTLEKYGKPFEGAVYRNERFASYGEARQKFAERVAFFEKNKGQTIVFNDFTSTTSKKSIAGRFGTDLRFKIQSKTGRYLPEPVQRGEEEVLFAPGKLFRVIKILRSGDQYTVHLEEII
jgi:hypothetical protein